MARCSTATASPSSWKSKAWATTCKYAGNLDIMTAAGARTAEMFAEEILAGRLQLESNRATMVA